MRKNTGAGRRRGVSSHLSSGLSHLLHSRDGVLMAASLPPGLL